MTTTTTGSTGQAPSAATPGQGQAPAGTQDQQGPGSETGQAPGGGAEFDPSTIQDPAVKAYLERQASELRRARDEAARFRTERGTLAEQVQQYQRAGETAEQAAQRQQAESQERLAALERENRTLKVTGAVTAAAQTAGAFNPARVAALLDAEIQTDEQGRPTNVADALAALKASDPYLFRRENGGADAGAGAGQGSPTGAVDINALIRNGGRVSAR